MYELVAINKRGGSVRFSGRTMKEAQDKFDTAYSSRKGFLIYIRNDNGVVTGIVRTTFRK